MLEKQVCPQPAEVGVLAGGLTFRANGNYGSLFYSQLGNGNFIEIAICDECIKRKKLIARKMRIVIEEKSEVCEWKADG